MKPTDPKWCKWLASVSNDPMEPANWSESRLPEDGDSICIPEFITKETYPRFSGEIPWALDTFFDVSGVSIPLPAEVRYHGLASDGG